MIEIAVTIGVLASAGTAAVALYVLMALRADLRRMEERTVARHGALLAALADRGPSGDPEEVRQLRGAIVTAARDVERAAASLEAAMGATRDVESVQQVRDAILELSGHLRDAHDRLDVQVDRSGELIERLHELVRAWSEGHSELELAWQRLAETVEAAVTVDAARREELRAALRAVSAGGGDAPR